MNNFGYFPAKNLPTKKKLRKQQTRPPTLVTNPGVQYLDLDPWLLGLDLSHLPMKGLTTLESPGRMEKDAHCQGFPLQISKWMRWMMEQNLILCFTLVDAINPKKPPGWNVCLALFGCETGSLWENGGRSPQFEWDQTGIDRLHYITSEDSLTKATRPFEMAMMLEITTDGPCGLRQWLCDTAPPFGCHTTTTTTTFTQTSTLHLHKESFAASFQNPSLRCSGDKEHIPWATTNTKCERVTLLRHSIDSAICAYHFEDSRCYVWLGAPKSFGVPSLVPYFSQCSNIHAWHWSPMKMKWSLHLLVVQVWLSRTVWWTFRLLVADGLFDFRVEKFAQRPKGSKK